MASMAVHPCGENEKKTRNKNQTKQTRFVSYQINNKKGFKLNWTGLFDRRENQWECAETRD